MAELKKTEIIDNNNNKSTMERKAVFHRGLQKELIN